MVFHSLNFPFFCYFLLFYAIFMNGYNCVANNLTIAALVFLGAKVGVYSEIIFHWLIFPIFCYLGILSIPYYI